MAINAEVISSQWLAKGREAEEHGNKKAAVACFEAADRWLAKANELRGW